jgi:hypothetical protein
VVAQANAKTYKPPPDAEPMRIAASPTERTTAATDIMLSLSAAGGIVLLQSLAPPAPWRLHLWTGTFGLIALAAALGAAYHGLVLAERPRRFLWGILTVCLSLAVSLFGVGVVLDAFGAAAARRLLPVLLAAGLLVYAVSRCLAGRLMIFMGYQTLVLTLALAIYAGLAVQGVPEGAGWMTAGVAASLVAAATQARRNLEITLIWEFDHNGIFHLIQALGVIFFCVGLYR